MYVWCMYVGLEGYSHSMCVEVRRQLCEIGSLLYKVLGIELRPAGCVASSFAF